MLLFLSHCTSWFDFLQQAVSPSQSWCHLDPIQLFSILIIGSSYGLNKTGKQQFIYKVGVSSFSLSAFCTAVYLRLSTTSLVIFHLLLLAHLQEGSSLTMLDTHHANPLERRWPSFLHVTGRYVSVILILLMSSVIWTTFRDHILEIKNFQGLSQEMSDEPRGYRSRTTEKAWSQHPDSLNITDCMEVDTFFGGGQSSQLWYGRRDLLKIRLFSPFFAKPTYVSFWYQFLSHPFIFSCFINRSFHSEERSLPFLGTNVDYDITSWTTRLMNGLDFPIEHKVIAAGGCEPHLMDQLQALRTEHPEINIIRGRQHLGKKSFLLKPSSPPQPHLSLESPRKMLVTCINCTFFTGVAPGWNRLLKYMEYNSEIPFGIIVNNDIYTPPGMKWSQKMIEVHRDMNFHYLLNIRSTTQFIERVVDVVRRGSQVVPCIFQALLLHVICYYSTRVASPRFLWRKYLSSVLGRQWHAHTIWSSRRSRSMLTGSKP